VQDAAIHFFTDFDGTVSWQDSLKLLLEAHGDSRWRLWESQIHTGELSEKKALEQMFAAFPLSRSEMLRFVTENVSIDPTFKEFIAWAKDEGHAITILSGGFTSLIRELLRREGLENLKVIANDIEGFESAWTVRPAPSKALCPLCTHCKSASLMEVDRRSPQTLRVYIGDGHTDYCPQQLAHLVFARGSLLRYCQATGREAIPLESFAQVKSHILQLMPIAA
jgi:HAD superfamily phosphoserine phosphatase-like hydrolase